MNDLNGFRQDAAALESQLIQWRRALHQIPETGTTLPQTMTYIKEQLDKMKISYESFEDISCIVATIGSGGKCFLLRSDVDAIPITEETDLDFRSTNGCMHACGHDLHGTILLGAAQLLKNHESELKGTVKLFFQSGEEVFRGAKAAINAGILENPHVDAALAAHVVAIMPVGIAVTGKEVMASVDGFKITVNGHGGHGSTPEATIDPINTAVHIYLALQSLIARETGGTEEAVLTIGQFSAGSACNVIPQQAVLQGTLRTFSPAVRSRLLDRIREITAGVCATYRCTWEYEELSSCPSVITDDTVTELAKKSILAVAPQFQILDIAHGMGSEDFAEIAQRVPSAHFLLGAGPEKEEDRHGLHNPKIQFNEAILPVGAALYAQTAVNWLKENQ